MIRFGILTSHPIQYQAPLFRALDKKVDLKVFFAHRQSAKEQATAGFGVEFDWDIDLLEGYRYEFLENVSNNPSVDCFSGCDTPVIREKINTGDFDVFLVTGWYLKSYWQAIRACRSLNVPVLVRGDSQLDTQRSLLKRMLKAVVYRILLKQFDAFLTVGMKNREYLEHYGVPKNKIFFSPHFVDNEWFQQRVQDTKRNETLMSLGCDPNNKVVLFVGKFINVKRPIDLIQALHLLKSRVSNKKIQLLFVGAGSLETQLRYEAEKLEVASVFAGFKNQTFLPAIYAASDLLVLPSASETWGLVVNEAMACGTPAVVSSAVGCAADLIETGKTGEVYPVGDVHALARAIKTTLEFAQCLETKHSLKRIMSKYSLQNATNGVHEASLRLLNSNNEKDHIR